jgi:hypothetical protein
MQTDVIEWLLKGDVSIQYFTHTHILGRDASFVKSLQGRIEQEGYGKRLLDCQGESGHWGNWYYQPKWTSTHYTLYALRHLGIRHEVPACTQMVTRALDECMLPSGGMNLAKSPLPSDSAVDGMFLDYAVYFRPNDERIEPLVAHLLSQKKPNGGYSWDHSSPVGDPHTTICVTEGFLAYLESGLYTHRHRVQEAAAEAVAFMIDHDLFWNSDTRFLRLTYPHYYRYDQLRLLAAAARLNYPCVMKLQRAVECLKQKQKDGLWHLEYTHPGAVHFTYEQKHEPSRFITCKALYILKHFLPDDCADAL